MRRLVYVYLRVSTGRQRNMATIETQRSVIAEYCRQNNISPQDVIEFADDGVSSRVPFHNRPGSKALFEAVKQGLVHTLLVYRLDRLGRDGDNTDTQTAVYELWELGLVKLVSMKEGWIQNNPQGRLMLGIQCAVAGYERESTVEKCDDALRRLAAEKKKMWMGGITSFGFRKEGSHKEAELVKATDLIPGYNLSEVDFSVKIFRKAADEGESCCAIGDYMTALGVPTVSGRAGRKALDQETAGVWWPSYIRSIITNPAYKGEYYWGKRKAVWDKSGKRHLKAVPRENWIKKSCPQIVDPDLWERANAAIRQSQMARMRTPSATTCFAV